MSGLGQLCRVDAPSLLSHLRTHLALVFPDAGLPPRVSRVGGAGGRAQAVAREHLGPADGLRHQH